MSREQYKRDGGVIVVPTAGTPVPLSPTPLFVRSYWVQASPANSDFMRLGTITGQNLWLEPRRSFHEWADPMDLGGSGQIDLSTVYVDAEVNGESVSFGYLRSF